MIKLFRMTIRLANGETVTREAEAVIDEGGWCKLGHFDKDGHFIEVERFNFQHVVSIAMENE